MLSPLKRLIKLALVLALISTAQSTALAQMSCDRAHSGLKPFSLEWRVESKSKEIVKDSEGNADLLANSGVLTVSEQALAPKSKTALMELIRMIAATRAVKFSIKEFEGKEFGKLVLGIPLENKYSVEVTYKSDHREGQEPRYAVDQMKIITPSGKSDIARNNLQTLEGGLDPSIRIDLSDYPALSNKEIKLHIPVEISGEALTAFAGVAPKLDLLTKQELREISQTNNYLKLKTLIHYRATKAFIKEYMVKGYFKTFYKLVVGIPLIFFITAQVNTHFKPQVDSVRTMLAGDQSQWIVRSLDKAIESEKTPAPVRAQLRELLNDFEKGQKDPAITAQLQRQYPPDLNSPSKFQVNKEQFLWVETVFDKELNKEITLLFITQDNKFGQIQYSVTALDRQKFATLINYIQSRGQFMPLVAGDAR